MTHPIDEAAPIDIRNCARCGEDHDNLMPEKLDRPHNPDGPEKYTHYAPCPTNGQPILWAVIENHEEEQTDE